MYTYIHILLPFGFPRPSPPEGHKTKSHPVHPSPSRAKSHLVPRKNRSQSPWRITSVRDHKSSGLQPNLVELDASMSTMEKSQKSSPPKIIKLDTALKLAEKWVSNMSKAEDDEPIVVVGRPARLGLGAKILRQSKIGPLKDPLERKLYAKLDTRTKIAEESPLVANKKDGNGNDSDDSEDLESRTKVFDKKRAANQVKPSVQTKKRKK